MNCNPRERADGARHLFPGGSVWSNESGSGIGESLQQAPQGWRHHHHHYRRHHHSCVVDADNRGMQNLVLQIQSSYIIIVSVDTGEVYIIYYTVNIMLAA